jgi:hypothetical protein
VVEPFSTDVWVVCEYHLPLAGERIDVVLLGHSKNETANAVIIELKQWSTVDVDGNSLVVRTDVEHSHPSQQALDYAGWLTDTHSAFVSGALRANACSFLHNLQPNAEEPLVRSQFKTLLCESPMFCATDCEALFEHFDRLLAGGGGKAVFGEFGPGRFQASPKLLAAVEDTIRNDKRWHLIGNQRIAYDEIMSRVFALRRKKGRHAVVVRGGPGTGRRSLPSSSWRMPFDRDAAPSTRAAGWHSAPSCAASLEKRRNYSDGSSLQGSSDLGPRPPPRR